MEVVRASEEAGLTLVARWLHVYNWLNWWTFYSKRSRRQFDELAVSLRLLLDVMCQWLALSRRWTSSRMTHGMTMSLVDRGVARS